VHCAIVHLEDDVMKRLTGTILVLLALAGTAWGQNPEKDPNSLPPPVPPQTPLAPTAAVPPGDVDLSVGDKAPDFQLDGSLGSPVRLADLKGHWSVLVFDEIRTKLGRLKAVDDSIRVLGARQYGICPDGAGALKTWAGREGVAFPLLSDPTGDVSRLFGMYDEGNEVIQSGLVLVDPQGVIRATFEGPSLHPDDVLRLVKHTIVGS
jgi:mycoredoxin-dependent peroxiredoxin